MLKNRSDKPKLVKIKKVCVGDLVALLSSITGEVIDGYPYGIILERKIGYPSGLSSDKEKKEIISVLFDGSIEEFVDIIWLLKID
jgi:hypothetical protein|tara:strand:+ start:240 stop:494 length:255 start_codon:yes stop_codon:yes gene_type:complete